MTPTKTFVFPPSPIIVLPAGSFFPPGAKGKADRQLDFFQESFDSCEVNGTHHGMPSVSQVAGWKARAAGRFEFCLKVHHDVTHPEAGVPESRALETFGVRRTLLHSAELRFPSPADGGEITVRAASEPDFAQLFRPR